MNSSVKSTALLATKKKLNLAFNLLIAALGISALFIRFSEYGLLAFRAFTNDANLYTTIITVIAVFYNIKALKTTEDYTNRTLYFLELASAVSEAVIFIIVMSGYLPFFSDTPSITPYHMFCLHVGIPVLSVVRFIFLETPIGILKPLKILIGSIPIAVYGIGVVSAIKLGILPIDLVPYSFLNFDDNFLWYFLFAMFCIPGFGYLWCWLFYRLSIRTSLLWYNKEDVEKLQEARVKALSRFDVVHSSLLIFYYAMALLLLTLSLRGTSVTSTKIQHEMMSYISFYMLDDYSNMLGSDEWCIRDDALYKGDIFIGDGTEENANPDILTDDLVVYETSIFVKASDLSGDIASRYDPDDYVCVKHSSGAKGPVSLCGEILDRELLAELLSEESLFTYKEETVDGEKYYHFCACFGKTLYEDGVGIFSLYVPSSQLTTQAKEAEYNHDIMMIAVVTIIFTILYIVSYQWIKALERSYEYVKAIASGRTPEDPIVLGKTARFSGLTRELNVLREINEDR